MKDWIIKNALGWKRPLKSVTNAIKSTKSSADKNWSERENSKMSPINLGGAGLIIQIR